MDAFSALVRDYHEVPPVTKGYLTAAFITSGLVQIDILSPFQLYFNTKLIFGAHQYWRLITPFLFFGPLGFTFMFNMTFTYRYCRMLEESFYRNRTADFVYMFLIGGILVIIIAAFVNLVFLSSAFTIMLVYVWGRRNPRVMMNFFGMIQFRAPYLPWMIFGASMVIGNPLAIDLIGIAVGHFYYFFEDVFPNQPHGFRLLKTPNILKNIFARLGFDEIYVVEDDDRPERFNFPNPNNPAAEPIPDQPAPEAQSAQPGLNQGERNVPDRPTAQQQQQQQAGAQREHQD